MSPLAERARAMSWAAVRRTIAARYPDVPTVSSAELADRLATPNPPGLLDVRTAEEFAVSHLSGARRVEPGTVPGDLLALDRSVALVAYCSVGVRSAALVQALQEAGFCEVANLDGSLFAWANEGRPVVQASGAATAVHPYDARWGLLLHPDRRARQEDQSEKRSGGIARRG